VTRPLTWPAGADDVIRARYNRTPGRHAAGHTAQLARELGVQAHNVRQRARQLGLSGDRQGRDWTPEELKALELVIRRGATIPTIAQATGRTRASVAMKCKKLRLHRQRVPRGTGEYGWRGVLSLDQVRAAFQEGYIPAPDPDHVQGSGQRRIWTRAETDFLIEHVGQKPLKWIAEQLGRTVRAVQHKCHYLDCHPTMNAPGLLIAEVMERTNRTKQQVYRALQAGDLKAKKAHTRKRLPWVFDEKSVEKYAAKLQAALWETDSERADTIRERWLPIRDFALQAGVSTAKAYRLVEELKLEGRYVNLPGRGHGHHLFLNPRDVKAARGLRVANWRRERAA
jgi:hypothetical protein